MSERVWIVTASATPGDDPFEGSVIRWCGICGCDVWLSPAAITRMAANHRMTPLCLDCAVPLLADESHVMMQAVDPTAPEAKVIAAKLATVIRDVRKVKRNR